MVLVKEQREEFIDELLEVYKEYDKLFEVMIDE